jgi:hypothetical protein
MAKRWRTIALLMLATTLALQPTMSFAEPHIGNAASVKNQVEGVFQGETQTLSSGSAVYSNELLRTGQESIAELEFLDSTKLSVGPISTVRLDKFVYDPNKQAGTVVVNVSRGAYRFITGVQDPRSYEIKTPYATLGVRGTVLEIVVPKQARAADANPVGPGFAADMPVKARPADQNAPPERGCREGYVRVRLVEGAFYAKTISKNPKTVWVTEPDTVLTVCSNGTVATGTSSTSILNFTPAAVAVVPPVLPIAAAVAAVAAAAVAAQGGHPQPPVTPSGGPVD